MDDVTIAMQMFQEHGKINMRELYNEVLKQTGKKLKKADVEKIIAVVSEAAVAQPVLTSVAVNVLPDDFDTILTQALAGKDLSELSLNNLKTLLLEFGISNETFAEHKSVIKEKINTYIHDKQEVAQVTKTTEQELKPIEKSYAQEQKKELQRQRRDAKLKEKAIALKETKKANSEKYKEMKIESTRKAAAARASKKQTLVAASVGLPPIVVAAEEEEVVEEQSAEELSKIFMNMYMYGSRYSVSVETSALTTLKDATCDIEFIMKMSYDIALERGRECYGDYPMLQNILQLKLTSPKTIQLHTVAGKTIAMPPVLKLNLDVMTAKSRVDELDSKRFSLAASKVDAFKTYIRGYSRTHPYITNAYVKCWEMLHEFKLIEKKPNNVIFCNAELPGAFIFSIMQYMKKSKIEKYTWYGNSLLEGLQDTFSLLRNNPRNWLMTDENKGDVLNPQMTKDIREKLGGKVDLYTSDIGVPKLTKEHMIYQERYEARLNLAQIMDGLYSLADGGNMVIKMFMFFTNFNRSLLCMLTKHFSAVYITKPATSRPANSEVYLICKGYIGLPPDNIMTTIEDYVYNWDDSMIDLTPFGLPTAEVWLDLVYASYLIYSSQINALDKVITVYNTNVTTTTAQIVELETWKKKYGAGFS